MSAPPARTRTAADALRVAIVPGAVFDAPFESGCVALTAPDEYGAFDGRDSDGVVCSFCVAPGGMPLLLVERGA